MKIIFFYALIPSPTITILWRVNCAVNIGLFLRLSGFSFSAPTKP